VSGGPPVDPELIALVAELRDLAFLEIMTATCLKCHTDLTIMGYDGLESFEIQHQNNQTHAEGCGGFGRIRFYGRHIHIIREDP